MKRSIMGLCIAVLILSGCQTTGQGTGGQDCQQSGKIFGALLGAAAGAFLGSKVGRGKGNLAAVALGALAGAWAGKAIFESLSCQDQNVHFKTREEALNKAAPGQWRKWDNPEAGTGGSSTIKSEGLNPKGEQCKTTADEIFTPEGKEKSTTVACKNLKTGEWYLADAGDQQKRGAWQPSVN